MNSNRKAKSTVEQESVKKKKRKRIKDENRAFNPRQVGTGVGDGALNILTDSSKTVTDSNGQTIPKKTAFLFASPAKALLDEKSKKELKEKFNSIKTNRPAVAIEHFENGVPKTLQTPDKTLLNYRGGAHGFGYSYVNRSPLKEIKNVEIKKEFLDSKENQGVLPNPEGKKTQTMALTKAMLAKSKRKIKQNHGKRSIAQGAVMKAADSKENASATKIAEAAGVIPGIDKHWGHAVGHQFLADAGQTAINLSIVTKHANGCYLANLEYALKLLIESFEKVIFTTNVQCPAGTHFQETNQVTLEVEDCFKLEMTFDGKQLQPTDKSSKEYMCAYAQILITQYLKEKRPATISPPRDNKSKTATTSPSLFFSRQENKKALEEKEKIRQNDRKESKTEETNPQNNIKLFAKNKSKRRRLNMEEEALVPPVNPKR